MNTTMNQQHKRKTFEDNGTAFASAKRIHTQALPSQDYYLPSPEDHPMDESSLASFTQPIPVPSLSSLAPPPAAEAFRPSTPPLGMTLAHFNPSTGGYTSSQVNSNHEVNSKICTGMTPVYRAPFERWGSCLI